VPAEAPAEEVTPPRTPEEVRAVLDAYRSYEGTVPHSLEDELDLLLDRTERLVRGHEALGDDPTTEELAALEREVDREVGGDDVLEAQVALDGYYLRHCEPPA
jgi:hypothetical protein